MMVGHLLISIQIHFLDQEPDPTPSLGHFSRDSVGISDVGAYFLFFFYLFVFFLSLSSFTRDWRYHKEERVWITRAPGMEPTLKTNTYERGTYYFFDCHNWRKVAKVRPEGGLLRYIHWLLWKSCSNSARISKEFHLEYDKLEERPHVPTTFNYNPAQQAF